MFIRVFSGLLKGINSDIVKVEIDISQGLPAFIIVGKTDTAISEATKRIKSAIKNSGFKFPQKKITVNLSPAYIKKEGTLYDLAIATGLLKLIEDIKINLDNYFIFGELSLDGIVYPVQGSIPLMLSAIKNNFKKIIIPYENKNEAYLIKKIYKDIQLLTVKNLKEVFELLQGKEDNYILKEIEVNLEKKENNSKIDFKDVKAAYFEKFAMQISAIGRHNLLMVGPPGSGKSMLAKRLPTIMPELTKQQQIETVSIHSLNSLDLTDILKGYIPFRAPHHSISYAGLIGGGRDIKPGEISLAHNGILFLDELAEFSKHTLETLRQPLEDKQITISRAQNSITYPANFLFIAASNPCPCGYLGDKEKRCVCSLNEIKKYISKFSGPLLDRFDIIIRVDRINIQHLLKDTITESNKSSKEMKEEVINALKFKESRGQNIFNSELKGKSFNIHIKDKIDKDGITLIKEAENKFKYSARVINKILKVSRSIADLKNSIKISPTHISQALQLRKYDILSLI